jgi:hypothetical protein
MITKENIEAYLLDFQEGNLSQFEIKELMDFVALHPAFKDDLDIQPLPIDPSIEFSNKESLKKTIAIKPLVFDSLHENEEELFIVAKIENELIETEELHFNRALQADKNFEAQFKAYSKTIIQVDNSLIFENKEQLKRTASLALVFNFRRVISYAAAASVLLFAGYLFFRTSPKVGEEKKSAGKENMKNEKQITPNSIEEKQESIKFANDFNTTIKYKVNSNDSLPKTNNSVVPQEPILGVQEVDSSKFTSENNNQDFAFVAPIETTNPVEESLSSKTETLTIKSYFVQKVNQVLYGKSNPSDEEKYASFSQKVSTATGISFDFKRRKSRSNREFHLKIGKFSIDRKKSN